MRPIKFRAWDKERNVMIWSDYDNFEWYKDEWYTDVQYMDLCGIENMSKNERYDLMQLTWLIDRNWKEIYEWDILGCWPEDDSTCDIVFEKWSFKKHFVMEEWSVKIHEPREFTTLWDTVDSKMWEIIWNIYENPELLTK